MTNAKHLMMLMALGITGAGLALIMSLLAPADDSVDTPDGASAEAQHAAVQPRALDASVHGAGHQADASPTEDAANEVDADSLPDTAAAVADAAVADAMPTAGAAQPPPSDTPPSDTPPTEAGAPSSPTPPDASAAPPDSAAPPPIEHQLIQSAIREQFVPTARRCYEELLKQFPGDELSGRVVLAFEVTTHQEQGRVDLAEPGEGSTLLDERLHDCMLEGLGEVIFPAPPGNEKLRVNYPVQFATTPGE